MDRLRKRYGKYNAEISLKGRFFKKPSLLGALDCQCDDPSVFQGNLAFYATSKCQYSTEYCERN